MVLEDMYRYYKNSSVKTASLKEIQKYFQEVPLNIKQAKHHRWLSHNAAILSIVRTYISIVADLESNTVAANTVGNGLLKQLKKPINVMSLYFLADYIEPLFPKQQCEPWHSKTSLEKTIRLLDKERTTDDVWLSKTTSLLQELEVTMTDKEADSFQTARDRFLDALTNNIERRFEDCEVMEALCVLDMSGLTDIPSFYGTVQMETLAEHFLMDINDLQLHWQGFSELMSDTPAERRSIIQMAQLLHGQQHAGTCCVIPTCCPFDCCSSYATSQHSRSGESFQPTEAGENKPSMFIISSHTQHTQQAVER